MEPVPLLDSWVPEEFLLRRRSHRSSHSLRRSRQPCPGGGDKMPRLSGT